jgi:hypothetical protein
MAVFENNKLRIKLTSTFTHIKPAAAATTKTKT